MYFAYSSFTAVVNICCIVASIALIVAFWKNARDWERVVMALFFMLFTVFQPLILYINSVQLLKGKAEELELSFDDSGMLVKVGESSEKLSWSDIKGFSVKPTVVILTTGGGRGYILNNRVLGGTRRDFVAFVRERMEQK